MDTSGDDSDTEGDGEGMSVTDSNDPTAYGNSPLAPRPRADTEKHPLDGLRLPGSWRKLVDAYFAYTHCWFPILDQAQIMQTAMDYPPEGIPRPCGQLDVAPRHAELWAVLALASFQDASSGSPSGESMSPKSMYSIARSLIPSGERHFETPHLRALLLHALIHIGQGADLAAWMLVGTATRLALHLRGTGDLFMDGNRRDESTSRLGILAMASCFILDTLTSACLGQPPTLQADLGDVLNIVTSLGESAEDEAWRPIPGFGSAFQELVAQQAYIQPLRTFRQLLNFTQILSLNLNTASHNEFPNSTAAAEDLAKSLDPKYSFCNSVIFGSSTPLVPSAFLLQIAFLATTTRLVQVHRASIISSLVEVVESCVSAFGVCGTPPIVVAFLSLVQRCGHINKMHEAEQTKWHSLMESLRQVWKKDEPSQAQLAAPYGTPYSSTPGSHRVTGGPPTGDFSVGYESGHMQRGYLPTRANNHMTAQLDSPHHQSQLHPGSGYTLPQQTHGRHSGTQGFPMSPPGKSPAAASRTVPLASPSMSFQSSGIRGAGPSTLFHGGTELANHSVDYDAILEELGSIDCPDGLDMDPQFMTNLGFAPGCDLGEMFQGDFGV